MRNAGLDLLRLLAILLVFGAHLRLEFADSHFLTTWKRGGWIGVDLFFVLSGFLISSLLFKEYSRTSHIDIRRFLIRRGFKIYPTFYVFLILTTLFRVSYFGEHVTARNLAGEILFLQNYLGMLWNHTWSLAVEEHFYLGIAAIFGTYLMVGRQRTGADFSFVPAMFSFAAISCLLARLATTASHPDYSFYRDSAPTHLRVDSLLFGVLIAYGVHFKNLSYRLEKMPSSLLLISGGLLMTPAFIFARDTAPWMNVYGVVLLYLGSGLLLLAAIRYSVGSFYTSKLAALGAASYPIYLWHMPVNAWAYSAFRQISGIESSWAYLSIYLGGSCALGWTANRLLEKPMIRLRDHLFPGRVEILARDDTFATSPGEPR